MDLINSQVAIQLDDALRRWTGVEPRGSKAFWSRDTELLIGRPIGS